MNLFISDVIEIPKFHWFIRSGGGVHRWGNAWKHISTDVRQNTPVDFRAFSVTRHLPSCKITAVIGLLHITHANEWVMKLFQFKSVRCVNLTNVQLTFYTWNQKRGKQENLFCIKLRCADKAFLVVVLTIFDDELCMFSSNFFFHSEILRKLCIIIIK